MTTIFKYNFIGENKQTHFIMYQEIDKYYISINLFANEDKTEIIFLSNILNNNQEDKLIDDDDMDGVIYTTQLEKSIDKTFITNFIHWNKENKLYNWIFDEIIEKWDSLKKYLDEEEN